MAAAFPEEPLLGLLGEEKPCAAFNTRVVHTHVDAEILGAGEQLEQDGRSLLLHGLVEKLLPLLRVLRLAGNVVTGFLLHILRKG